MSHDTHERTADWTSNAVNLAIGGTVAIVVGVEIALTTTARLAATGPVEVVGPPGIRLQPMVLLGAAGLVWAASWLLRDREEGAPRW